MLVAESFNWLFFMHHCRALYTNIAISGKCAYPSKHNFSKMTIIKPVSEIFLISWKKSKYDFSAQSVQRLSCHMKQLSYRAGCQEVSMCRSRDESEESAEEMKHSSEWIHPGFETQVEVTWSPKKGYQWPLLQKMFKIEYDVYREGGSTRGLRRERVTWRDSDRVQSEETPASESFRSKLHTYSNSFVDSYMATSIHNA